MNPGLTPSVGQQFTIINNQSGTPITTTFAGLPQNAVTTIGGFSFSINYSAGVGNDSVVLTRVAAPPSVALNPPSANYTSTWTGTALGIGPTATVADPSGGNVLSLTASLTSVHGGDVLADGTAERQCRGGEFSITSSYNAGTGVPARSAERTPRLITSKCWSRSRTTTAAAGRESAPKPSAWWPRMPSVAARRSPTRSP